MTWLRSGKVLLVPVINIAVAWKVSIQFLSLATVIGSTYHRCPSEAGSSLVAGFHLILEQQGVYLLFFNY